MVLKFHYLYHLFKKKIIYYIKPKLIFLNYIFKNKIVNYIDAKNFGDLFETQNSKWFEIPFRLPNSERDNSKKLVNLDNDFLKKA